MHKLTFSVLVSLFLFVNVAFANDTIVNTFKSKNEAEKVSYFRNLHKEDKIKHLQFFENSFSELVEENKKNKTKNS